MADVEDAIATEGAGAEPAKKKRRSRWGQEPAAVEGNSLVATGVSNVPANYPTMSFGQTDARVAPAVDLAAAASAARDALEKAKKAAQFQRQIAEQMALLRGNQAKPRKLILEEFGRELDEDGKVVPMKPAVTATLQVNVAHATDDAQARAGLPLKTGTRKTIAKPDTRWFDSRMKAPRGLERRSKAVNFFEEGTLVKQEKKIIRKKEDKMLERSVKEKHELKREEHQARVKKFVKKEEGDDTGAPIFTEIKVKKLDPVPPVEWWDKMILDPCANDTDFPFQLAERKVTAYIEHPVPIKQAIPEPEVKAQMHLTPAEQKKFRKLRKQERTREYQDKIKMGLLKPPPPKVKMSNLMRVLGDSAIADPSAVEKRVRGEMAERMDAHEARNDAAKLTPEERKTKKVNKWQNVSGATQVLLFKVRQGGLQSKRHTFKVDANAKQYHMTGFCIVSPAGNMVLVEGNIKSCKRYKRLMTRRIKWDEDVDEESEDDDDDDDEESKRKNDCQLVWEGEVVKRMCKEWKIVNAKNENEIRAALQEAKSEHYWDMVKRYRSAEQDL